MVKAIIPSLETDTLIVSGSATLPANCIGDTQISSSSADRIASTKVGQQKVIQYRYGQYTTTVADDTVTVYLSQGTTGASVKEVYLRCETSPSGGDKSFTLDCKKAAAGSGSYSSILSGAISPGADNTKVDGTVSTSALSAGDALQIAVVTSGTTGTQGAGLSAFIIIEETSDG